MAKPLLYSLLGFALLSGCLDDADDADDEPTTSSDEQDLHGPVTWDYDAVGRVIVIYPDWSEKHCTGTLINRRTVLTAAHCVDYKNLGVGAHSNLDVQFDMKHSAGGMSYSYAVDGWRVFGKDAGPDDIAILHLTSAVTEFTPAKLRRDKPSAGEAATIVGYGIYDCPWFDVHIGHEDGRRRLHHYTWGKHVEEVLCGGDSGGPTFTKGQVAQVSSYVHDGRDHFGYVWPHYDQIQNWLAVWIACPSC